MKSKNNNIEFKLHQNIAKYLKSQYKNIFFFSDLNGIKMSIGMAKKIKTLKSNHKNIDLFICAKNSQYSGFFIEFKKSKDEIYTKKGEYRQDEHFLQQLKTKEIVEKQGFKHEFCYDFDLTKNFIDNYLK